MTDQILQYADVRRPRRTPFDFTRAVSYGFTAITVAALAGMLLLFVVQSIPIWQHLGFGYITGTKWFYTRQQFGAAPMLYGTAVVALIAVLLAAPLGIGTAIFAAEFLPPRGRLALKLIVELLAGIPSVVYGLLGILFLRNYVYDTLSDFGLDPRDGDTLLTAGLLLAVMVLPTIMTMADDALRGVPAAQRAAARGLGLTRTQAILTVSLPQARRGLVAAVLLGFGRALGETIAVMLVVGKQDNQWPASLLSLRPLMNAGQTLTSKMGGEETNTAYGDPLHWAAIVGLGLMLLVIVATVTLASAWLEGRADHNG